MRPNTGRHGTPLMGDSGSGLPDSLAIEGFCHQHSSFFSFSFTPFLTCIAVWWLSQPLLAPLLFPSHAFPLINLLLIETSYCLLLDGPGIMPFESIFHWFSSLSIPLLPLLSLLKLLQSCYCLTWHWSSFLFPVLLSPICTSLLLHYPWGGERALTSLKVESLETRASGQLVPFLLWV